MFEYIYIIIFLLTHDLTELKEYWHSDIIKNKKFSWLRLIIKTYRHRLIRCRYLFWFRLFNEMFQKGNRKQRKIALKLNQELITKYNIEIGLGAKIGKNFNLTHLSGIVITSYVEIGNNFTIKQNSTIGIKTTKQSHGIWKDNYKFKIGDNVFVGANSCIIADSITIGNNVNIGAMSFVNKDISDDCTVYSKKTNEIILKAH